MHASDTGGIAARLRAAWPWLRGDIAGGATTAVVLLAIEGSYGLVIFGSAGPGMAQLGFLCGVLSAALANLVAPLAGGRGPLLGGGSAALALLVPPLLAGLLADPLLSDAAGAPRLPWLLALLALGLALAGLIQMLAGWLRVGGMVRYVPYPVLAGFMNGVALLMVLAMLPYAGGLPAGAQDLSQAHPLALLVALATFAIALRPPRWTHWLPGPLTALLAGTALHHALLALVSADALGPPLGWVHLGDYPVDPFGPLQEVFAAGLPTAHAGLLLQFALVVALVSSLQSLMAQSVIDGLTRTRRDGERELVGTGVANMVVGLVGGMPVAGSVSRSRVSLDAGSTTTASRLSFGIALVMAATVGAPLLQHLPLAAIAGVFSVAAWNLVDPWSRSATLVLLRDRRRAPATLRNNVLLMLLVAAVCAGISITVGVALGVLLAMVSFVRGHSRQPVRSVTYADQRSSLRIRTPEAVAALKRHGGRIALVELDTSLFFGTADAVAAAIEAEGERCDEVLIDFRRVAEIDGSGARMLVQAVDRLQHRGRQVRLAGIAPTDPRGQLLGEMDLHRALGDEVFVADLDQALEQAEERLLARVGAQPAEPVRLPLSATLLAAGLDEGEIATLDALLVEHRLPAGTALFRRNEPSHALYVAVLGGIAIRLPTGTPDGGSRRIVSFAPGVAVGEMGLLQDRPRSADAVTEEDAVVLELSRAALDHLKAEHPRIALTLLLNLNLQLATRLRIVTDELQQALEDR